MQQRCAADPRALGLTGCVILFPLPGVHRGHPPSRKNGPDPAPPYSWCPLPVEIFSCARARAGIMVNLHKNGREDNAMAKRTIMVPTCEKYRQELQEIEDAAKAANCDTNFLYRTTLDRYVTQLDLLTNAQDDMNKNGLTVTKITPRGAEVEVANPAIQIYNQTASAANSTVSTLLRIVQTFKFMAAKADEDDEL